MKKGFLGYKVSEVDVIINALREENESLNATITILKTQIKNSETNSAKTNLLEADIRTLEENLKILNEENSGLSAQISSLSEKTESPSSIVALQSQLNSELENKLSLEQALHQKTEEASSVLEALNKANEKVKELEKALIEIGKSKDELAISILADEKLADLKAIDGNSGDTINLVSSISFQAYYEMTQIRNEVIEYIHEQMKEYYQRVNDNNVKICTAIEQHQAEYNQMIRDCFTKASEFRVSLSPIESSNYADFTLDIDKISNSMDQIMKNFIEKSNGHLKLGNAIPDMEEDNFIQEAASSNSTK